MSDKIVKPPLALANKILKITEEVQYIKKDGFNSFHKYNFVTDAKVLKVLRVKFVEYKMLGVPSAIKYEYNAENGMTTVNMLIALICCETGEKIEVPWIGQGADKGDKGCYKAFTGGYKTFLMKLFMIPTGDDPENWSPELDKEAKQVKSTKKSPIKAQKLEDII